MQIYQLLGLFYEEKEQFITNIQRYNIAKQSPLEPQYFILNIDIKLNILSQTLDKGVLMLC